MADFERLLYTKPYEATVPQCAAGKAAEIVLIPNRVSKTALAS